MIDPRLIKIPLLVILVIVALTISFVVIFQPAPLQNHYVDTDVADINFNYSGSPVSFSILVNQSSNNNRISTSSSIGEHYQQLISDPDQNTLLREIYLGFSEEKKKLHLDDDEFVDLVVRYVQSLEYATIQNMVKSPSETMLDQYGDCDDRALLLTGILAQAGYDVAIFSFQDEEHAAAGIRVAPGYDFQNTGYAYIETTGPAFIGDVPTLEGNISMQYATPVVIPIGNGTKQYGAMEEIWKILNMRTYAETELDRLSQLMLVQTNRVEMLKEQLPVYQNLRESDYQLKYDEYLRAISQQNKYVSQYNQYVDILNYIQDHVGERGSVYWALFP